MPAISFTWSELDQVLSDKQVTLTNARRILGREYESYTDDQIRVLIGSLHLLAKEVLCYDGSKISVGKNER